MIIFVQPIETRSNLSKPLKFYHSENTNQQKHVQIYPNDLLKHYIQQKYEFFIKLNHLLSHWKTHFFRIYYRNTWRETHPPCPIIALPIRCLRNRILPFFFFLFFFFPRFEIGFRSMQTSPLSFSGARKFFLLCWYIVGHKSCLNVTLRERLSECAQFLTHPSALQE